MISDFFDLGSIVALVSILILSVVVYYRIATTMEGIDKITSLAFYLSFIVALIRSIYVLQNMESPKHLGMALGFSLLLMFYAGLIKVSAIFYSRVFSERKT
jgi:hypothetical protein